MSGVRDAFDDAIDAWNRGDLDRYLELYDDAIQLHGYSDTPMNKTEVRAFYATIWRQLADIRLEIHETVEHDDWLAARFTMHGTHVAELAGVPSTGKRITQPGMTILHFAGARVVERWSVADMLAVLAQLGAFPA
jgi:steroid delta-isomerase-like uncharacterized protein